MDKLYKLIIGVLIACIATFSTVCWFVYEKGKESSLYSFYQIGQTYSNQTATALNGWINGQVKIAQFIAEKSIIIEACSNPEDITKIDDAREYLEEVHDRFPYYENLPLITFTSQSISPNTDGEKKEVKNGYVICDTVGDFTVGQGNLEVSFIKAIYEGTEYYISDVYPSVWRQNPIFVISVPVKKNDLLVGAVIISPQMDYFVERFIEDVKYMDTGYLSFVDERGMVFAHPNKDYILNTSDKFNKMAMKLIRKALDGNHFAEGSFFGVKKHYISAKLDLPRENVQSQWFVAFAQNNSEIFSESKKILIINICMSIFFTIMLAGIVYMLAKMNLKVIKEENLKLANRELEVKVKERTKELELLACTDSLTKLLNHTSCLERLSLEIEKAKSNASPLTVIMLDLDHFKEVNDAYGHLIGDEVLVKISKLIKTSIRNSDFAGRYGGEEFIIVLPNANIEISMQIAKRIQDQILLADYSISDLHVTASMGVCLWSGQTINEFVNWVDTLLYQAKCNGRNRIEHN